MSWAAKTLGELCDQSDGIVQTGPFGSQLKQSEYIDDVAGVPVVMPKDIKEGAIDEGEIARISESKANALSRHMLAAGDIVFPRRGEISKRGYIKEGGKYFCGTGCLKIHMPDNEVLNKYLFYYLDQDHVVKWLEGRAIGSTMLNLNTSIMRSVNINFPDLNSQKRIVSALSAYDDLIENNKRRIELLEESARQLYKEWFVRFRFPDHEHVKIIDGVPEGWKRLALPNVVDFKEGPGLRNYQYREEGIPFLNIRTFIDDEIDLSKTKCLDEIEVESKYRHFLLNINDHVVSSSGTLGRLVTIRNCHLPLLLNTSLIRMRPKAPMTTWLLKVYLKYGDFLDQAKSMATGSAQLNYGPSHLKLMSVLMPPDKLIEEFEASVESVYLQIKILLDCNISLKKTRDLLLPKLMSGEIVV